MDQALVQRRLCAGREQAQRAIMARRVVLNQRVARKASDLVNPADAVALAEAQRHVSRAWSVASIPLSRIHTVESTTKHTNQTKAKAHPAFSADPTSH